MIEADLGSTSGPVESTGDESSSGGFEPDCSMCNAQVAPNPACHSAFNASSGTCDCEAGYVYETADLDDFTCVPGDFCGSDPNVELSGSGRCTCADGYVWCSADPADLTCCASG